MFHPLVGDYQRAVFEIVKIHLSNNLDYTTTEPNSIVKLFDDFSSECNSLINENKLYKTRVLVDVFKKAWDACSKDKDDVVLRSVRYVVDDDVQGWLTNYQDTVNDSTIRALVAGTLTAIKEIIYPPEWNVVVLDVETGGLASYDYKLGTRGSLHYPLLQVSMRIYNEKLQPKTDSITVTINQPESELEKIGEYVTKMHTNNGLLEQVRSSTITQEQAEKQLLAFLEKHGVKRHSLKHNRFTIIAGNSIYTDKEWLNSKMSYLDRYFSYQLLDFSAFQLMNKMSDYAVYTPIKKYGHLADEDIIESVEEGRRFLEVFWMLQENGGFMSNDDKEYFGVK